jgi:O-antigen/teichoic acid export membrane protein
VLTREETLARILGTAAALRFATCVAGVPILVLLAYFSGDKYPDLIRFAVLAGVLNSLSCFAVLDYYFQSQLEARRSAIARVLAIGIVGSAEIVLLLADAGTNAFLWTLSFEQPLFGIMYYVVHRWTDGLPLREWQVDVRYGISLFSRSMKLSASAISSAVAFRIPVLLLARFATAGVVGLWGVAAQPVELWFVLANALAATLFPRMVRAREQGRHAYHRFLQGGFAALTACGTVLALGLILVAPLLLVRLYGSEFEGARVAMQIYALILPFVFFRAFMSKWLVLEEHYWLSVGSQFLGALCSVAIGFLVIRSYPFASSAAATTVAAAIASSVVALAISGSGRQLLWQLTRRSAADQTVEMQHP